MFKSVLKRDFILLWRRHLPLIPLMNLGIAALFLEWIGGHTPLVLSPYIAGIFVFLIFLNTLSSVDTLYQDDFKRGCLEDICLKSPLSTLIVGRYACFYLFAVLPSVFMVPLFACVFGATAFLTPLFGATLLSTMLFTALATTGSLLTLGYSSAQSLLVVLVLPLFVPLFIILAVFLESLRMGEPYFFLLKVMGGSCLILLPLCFVVSLWALKITLTDHLE